MAIIVMFHEASGKKNQDGLIPCIFEPEENSKEYRKSWACLIQKIYEVDPLTCTKCQGKMRIIAFIEDGGGHKKDFEISKALVSQKETLTKSQCSTITYPLRLFRFSDPIF